MYPTPLFCSTRIKCSPVAALFSRNISLLSSPLPLTIRWKASTGNNHLIFLTRLRTIFVFRCRNIQIWTGKSGGGEKRRVTSVRKRTQLYISRFHPLRVPRRWNKRSNKTTRLPSPPVQGFSPRDFGQIAVTPSLFPRWTVSSRYPCTLMGNILLYSVSSSARGTNERYRVQFINLVCSFSFIYIYKSSILELLV